jgi:phosphotransferase system enzyme I (PtsP)
MRYGEGVIGEVASTKKPTSSSNIFNHPKYVCKNEEEKNYPSMVAVPLLRSKRSIGVLTLRKKEIYEFSDAEIEILETAAMVISEVVSSDDMHDYKRKLISERGNANKNNRKGISLSKGYGIGTAIVHRRSQPIKNIFVEDKQKEIEKLAKSHKNMIDDLDKKIVENNVTDKEQLEILDAYKMLANDKGWLRKIADNIRSGLTAEAAAERVYEDMWNRLSAIKDVYLKERLHDLRDITDRLRSYLSGDLVEENVDAEDIIIIAKTMGPADLMDYDYNKIRGLVIEEGTPTMHVAIVAKALNIPVVAKVKGVFETINNKSLVAIDGNEGIIYINPDKQIQNTFNKKYLEKIEEAKKLEELKELPIVTKDGTDVNLYINVGLAFDLDYISITNCDGIGLYRTEIPFMASNEMPSVEEQTSYYKQLMDAAGDKRVVFRSLDVGSDKLLPYWNYKGEENPAIGWRSIRITLDRRAILRKQIRAFLRGAEGKVLNVMFPMISTISEFDDAKETLLLELEKEAKKGNPVPRDVKIGVMMEVPSLVFQLDELVNKVDFISIGTNDMAQFVFACDRGNSKLTNRYDVLSSPFLNMLSMVVQKCNKAGVHCSVCGEMGGNPIEALALLGLGFRHLSMSGSSFGRVKKMVRSVNIEEITDYMTDIINSSRKSIRPQLISYAYDHAIEI